VVQVVVFSLGFILVVGGVVHKYVTYIFLVDLYACRVEMIFIDWLTE